VDQIGKYSIQEELGRGGFGAVYRAWDPEMRRSVAIKVIHLHIGDDPAMLARFRSEAATTANLHHRNIVTIYDSGEHNGQPWFAMEFLDGKTLRKTLEETPALELWQKANILLQVAEGLQYAHDRGVVHRDIKPANVMLLEGGVVKVLDFGIARLTDPEMTQHMTATGMVQGTFGYLAPEQLEGAKGDPVSDIFSFGVVCYETLTGIQPFHANSLPHAVNLIANFNPEPIGKLVRNCPPRLQEIVQKAIAKDPARRYQSLRELILDLAPVELYLRTSRATELAVEAESRLKKGDSVAARACLDRALVLDRLNEKAQALRRRLPEVAPGDAETATIRLPIEPAVPAAGARKFPVLLVTLLVLIVAAAAGIYFFRMSSGPASRQDLVKQPASEPVTSPPVQPPAPEPAPPVAAPPSPADAIANAIQSRDWPNATARVNLFDKSNPHDPRVKDWRNQIDKGSAHDRKVAGLHSSIDEAIASGNWGKADSQIRKLFQEAPDDPGAEKLRRQVAEGYKQSARIKALRAAVKSEMKAKQWSDAERDIASLLSLVPGDSEAIHWKNDVARQRH
jgi:serine/threonine-protein kinase